MLAWAIASVGALRAQTPDSAVVPVTVDEAGVMRWTATGDEVALFGVNYSTPFAHAYRAHGYLGVDRKTAIDADVLHLARLGLDAYRIHVWDREVSDREGNLLENEHLDLLDYLLARLAEHGIKAILTPIAWWPPGYPEPDPPTDGLSDGYDKGQMTTDAVARRKQASYLRQFVRHRNPYTGLTYAEDPNLIAVEVINEPEHPGGPAETTAYVDAMAEALRTAGWRKPIFHNISQSYSDGHGRAVCAARIDGVSHQWYPTGLVRNGAVGGNMLPNVDRYTIPYADFPECRDKARMVYEFDAADVAGSYMYPAMARAFRGAGFQWATQFAYDPLAIAHANTEYQTHFLNLVHTPAKAISFLIAGEAFRRVPRGASYGTYPESERFGDLRVSYADDLSELVTDSAFYHSSHTETVPPDPAALRRLAGTGGSPVVGYEGTGAWFLDRLEDGVWRLEVYPDVAWVVDPFTRPSLAREASRVVWRTRAMRIALPDLGPDFSAEPVDSGNGHRPTVREGALDVRPGVYLLARAGTPRPDWTATTVVDGRRLGAFVAPPSSDAPAVVLHEPPEELTAGRLHVVRVEVVSREAPDSVALFARRVGAWGRMPRLRMEATGPFGYEAAVPAELLREGLLEYVVAVWEGGKARSFPGPAPGEPHRWDFTGRDGWRVPVVAAGAPILLFDARRDRDRLLVPHPWEYVPFRLDLVAGSGPGRLAQAGVVEDLSPAPRHLALRSFLTAGQRLRLGQVRDDAVLRVRARAAGREKDRMELALVERDGTAWGAVVELTDEWREVDVPLRELRRVPLALLPRPYPQFLPYLFESAFGRDAPRPAELDGLQFAVHAELFPADEVQGEHGFEVESVVLDPGP
jgi:hypothetical protein